MCVYVSTRLRVQNGNNLHEWVVQKLSKLCFLKKKSQVQIYFQNEQENSCDANTHIESHKYIFFKKIMKARLQVSKGRGLINSRWKKVDHAVRKAQS